VVGLNKVDFIRSDIFNRNALVLENVPYGAVQKNTLGVIAGQGFGNLEASHSAKLLLLFKEEELVGLHVELSANCCVVINHNVLNTMLKQQLACRQAGRPGANDGHGGFINPGAVQLISRFYARCIVLGYFTNLLNPINRGNANTFNLTIYQHLACSTLAYTAFEATFPIFETVAMNRISCLMKRRCNGKSFCPLYFITVK